MSQVLESPDSARSAAARHEWREAYDAYSEVAPADLTAEDLELYGEAAWWRGKLEQAIALRERAHGAYTAAGDKLGAARMAITLSWDHENRGAFAIANGWLANAERLLAGLPESPEHARLGLTHALAALFAEGDLEKAMDIFDKTYELSQRLGDRDCEVLALSGKGRTLIKGGNVEQGLALLDEATASAMSGDLRPHSTGLVYCLTISASRDLGDYRRAAEWTDAANRWCDRLDVSGFPGACRVHRAEVLRLRGDWPAAEAQALAACEELQDFDRRITASGHYEIGEIRRHRGDFAGAEESYRTADELGRTPQPGLALLRLAEGKVGEAVAAIGSAVRDSEEPLGRLRLLPAQVEISIAAGDLARAREAGEEFERIVDSYKIGSRRATAFDATARVSNGQIALAAGDFDGAVASLKGARDSWKDIGMPYEEAHARLLLGTAFRRQGDEYSAKAELEAALARFEKLGARLDEERAKELLGRVVTRRTLLFTDIVDSTKLLEAFGAEKWGKMLNRHDELVRSRIVEHGGEVIKKTGDGFFASFESPKAAINAAVAIQRALDEEIAAPDVRIGAHAGSAFRPDVDVKDYGGQGVHVAARIGAAAGRGEILVSAETLEGVGTSFRVSEPRTEQLKGIEQPVELVSVSWR